MLGNVKFDHKAPTARTKDVNKRPVLVQNGIIFTNAERNRFTGKYEPEPTPIKLDEPYRAMLMPKVLDLIDEIQKLNDTINQLIEPMKLVIASEAIETKTQGTEPDKIEPITDDSEFKFIKKDKFEDYVKNNKERIRMLEEDDPILSTLIKKWEHFYPGSPILI